MKWKTKSIKPQEGDKRRVRKFAFLPTRCNDYVVWLEIVILLFVHNRLAPFLALLMIHLQNK